MKTRSSGCARTSAESWVFVGRRDDTPPPRRPAPAPPGQGPADPGPVLYEDSFERVDIRERWGAVQELQSDHTARTSAAHARDGARCARFEVRDGDNAESSTDERQQLSDARMPDGSSFRPKEGDDFYIAISLWFEPGFPFAEGDAAWQVFWELVSFDADGNGPLKLVHGKLAGQPVRLAIEGKGAKFNVPPGGYYWYNDRDTITNGWHDFVIHVKFSQNPAVGFIELWHREPDEPNYVKQNFIQGTGAPGTKIFYATLLEC